MAGNFQNLGKDSLDINELAALNDDIPDELISELEQQLSEKIDQDKPNATSDVNENDDSTLFEETPQETTTNANTSETLSDGNDAPAEAVSAEGTKSKDTNNVKEENADVTNDNKASASKPEKAEVIQNFDDNFIKKYKAKLKNRAQGGGGDKGPSFGGVAPGGEETSDVKYDAGEEGDISALSQGKISERDLTGDIKNYNDSLDFLDKNVKYSKYVIYIDPQNVNFIESLTVKERKNLINGILRQQDDIAITKLRFKVIQTIIRHVIITVLTVAISIPVVYYVINASLEATINNHRSAQTNWQTLYKEHGKITPH